MFDKLKQLQEMKTKMEEIQKRLDNITVEGHSDGGKVKVFVNGNKKITNVHIDKVLFTSGDNKYLEEMIVIASNRALEQAEKVNQSEMMSMAGSMKGLIPGL